MFLTPELKTKLLKIRQNTNTWQCTVRRAPLWITPKNEPAYRPFILMVLDPDADKIVKTDINRERLNADTVLGHLFKAMQGSFFPPYPKQRPARISIDDAALAQACAPQLAELGIRCDFRSHLPEINNALLEMEAHMNKRDPMPGLHKLPGVSLPLVTELYAAAADYYRESPWKMIPNWMPIKIRYPADGPVRYALVLGQGGEFYGLSLYSSLSDVTCVLERRDFKKRLDPPIRWLSLLFNDPKMMNFDDLDAIDQYALPIAGEQAYPLLLRMDSDGVTDLPTPADVAWLAATLRVIPDFLTRDLHGGRGPLIEAESRKPLPNLHGGQQILLSFPATDERGINPLGDLMDPQLQAFIADWGWNDRNDEFARKLGRFLLEFLDTLDDLSGATVSKHEKNCQYIGWLACHYGRDKTFSPNMFLCAPRFEKEFQHKISRSKSALKSYEVTWRKLEKYARTIGQQEK